MRESDYEERENGLNDELIDFSSIGRNINDNSDIDDDNIIDFDDNNEINTTKKAVRSIKNQNDKTIREDKNIGKSAVNKKVNQRQGAGKKKSGVVKQGAGRRDPEVATLLIVDYNLKNTLSGKLDSYINLQMHKHEMETLGFEFLPNEAEDIEKCEEDFMKAFSKASEKQRTNLMRQLSEKKIECAEEYTKEKATINFMLQNQDDRDVDNIYYLADGSASATKLKVLDSIEQNLVEKKVLLETQVKDHTSMKDFRKLLGLSDADALKYLQDLEPKLVNAKEKKEKKKKNIFEEDEDDLGVNMFDNLEAQASKKKGSKKKSNQKKSAKSIDQELFEKYSTKTSQQSVYRYFNFKVGQPEFKKMVEKGEILLPGEQAKRFSPNPDKPLPHSRYIGGVLVTDQDYINYPSILKNKYDSEEDMEKEATLYDTKIVEDRPKSTLPQIIENTDLFFKNVEVSGDEYVKAVNDEIIKYKKNPTIESNLKSALTKKKISGQKASSIKSTINRATQEPKTDEIKNWIASRGGNMKETINTSVMRGLAADDKARLLQGTGYEKYILLHSGHSAYFKNPSRAPENFKKALAADILKLNEVKFDVKTIHKVAQNISEMPEYRRICNNPIKLMASLSDPEAIRNARDSIIKKTYGVSADNISEYVDKMQTVYNSMQPHGSQSTEYKNLRDAIDDIVKLKGKYKLETPEGREAAAEAVVALNAKLLEKSELYMKGKKSVRGSNEGIHRFNNTLDVLGLMCQYAPDTKNLIMVSVNRINTVRKAAINDENYIDIKKFNEKRAVKERKKMDENNGKAIRNNNNITL